MQRKYSSQEPEPSDKSREEEGGGKDKEPDEGDYGEGKDKESADGEYGGGNDK
jgi:hypothetical protein